MTTYALFNNCYCCPDSQKKHESWNCYYNDEFHGSIEEKDYIPYWCPRPDDDFIYDIQFCSNDFDRNLILIDAVNDLSREAKELIWIIFNRPEEFFKAFVQ